MTLHHDLSYTEQSSHLHLLAFPQFEWWISWLKRWTKDTKTQILYSSDSLFWDILPPKIYASCAKNCGIINIKDHFCNCSLEILPKPFQFKKTVDCRIKFHQKPKSDHPAPPSLFWSIAWKQWRHYMTQFIVEGQKSFTFHKLWQQLKLLRPAHLGKRQNCIRLDLHTSRRYS